jgi:hypothetical protein
MASAGAESDLRNLSGLRSILRRNGRKCFEAPGVEPVFLKQEQVIDYAVGRVCFRSGEIRVLDSSRAIQHVIPFAERDRRF